MFHQTNGMKTEVLKDAAIETVVKLATEVNPCEITTNRIANKMGRDANELSNYFATQEAIFQTVAEWVSDILLSRINKAVRSSQSPLEVVEAMFHAHLDFAIAHPGAPRMLLSQLQPSKVSVPQRMITALIEFYKHRIQDQLEIGKVRGEVFKDLDSEASATLFIGMIQGLVLQSLVVNDAKMVRSKASKVFAVFRRGIEESHD